MTHSWRLQAREFHIDLHMCSKCLLVRIKTTMASGFPKVRYIRGDQVTEGKVPACTAKPVL
jgi:hypothetical protein